MGSEATQGLSLSPEQQCASALRYDYDDYDLDRYTYGSLLKLSHICSVI